MSCSGFFVFATVSHITCSSPDSDVFEPSVCGVFRTNTPARAARSIALRASITLGPSALSCNRTVAPGLSSISRSPSRASTQGLRWLTMTSSHGASSRYSATLTCRMSTGGNGCQHLLPARLQAEIQPLCSTERSRRIGRVIPVKKMGTNG